MVQPLSTWIWLAGSSMAARARMRRSRVGIKSLLSSRSTRWPPRRRHSCWRRPQGRDRKPAPPRTVHHTADDGDIHRGDDVFEPLFQGIDRADDVELLTGAGGTGDEVDAAGTDAQGFEDVEAHLHLLHRIGGQGDAQGVANPFAQQHAKADGGLDRAGAKPPASVMPRCRG